jgi:hypothetical protein
MSQIDDRLVAEGLVPIHQIAASMPALRHSLRPTAHFGTIIRWATRGHVVGRGERVKLEAVRRGRVLYTSLAALERFEEAKRRAREPVVPKPESLAAATVDAPLVMREQTSE